MNAVMFAEDVFESHWKRTYVLFEYTYYKVAKKHFLEV